MAHIRHEMPSDSDVTPDGVTAKYTVTEGIYIVHPDGEELTPLLIVLAGYGPGGLDDDGRVLLLDFDEHPDPSVVVWYVWDESPQSGEEIELFAQKRATELAAKYPGQELTTDFGWFQVQI